MKLPWDLLLFGKFNFSGHTIQPYSTNSDVSFCTNSTSGTTISLGNLGTVKLGNIIKIREQRGFKNGGELYYLY